MQVPGNHVHLIVHEPLNDGWTLIEVQIPWEPTYKPKTAQVWLIRWPKSVIGVQARREDHINRISFDTLEFEYPFPVTIDATRWKEMIVQWTETTKKYYERAEKVDAGVKNVSMGALQLL